MQRKRDGLVPIGEALSGLGGPVKAIREASPQALHHFTQADQVNQLVGASEADPDPGFMARLLALCALPRTNPGNRLLYKRVNGPYRLYMQAGPENKLPLRQSAASITGLGVHRSGADAKVRAGPGRVAFRVHAEVGYLRHQRRKPGRADTASQPDEAAFPLQRFADLRG